MSASAIIHYLRNKEINRELWDQCIDNANNGLIYGYSFYLDQMVDNWDGMVVGNYEAVMPLPWRKKLGIYYLYQPFLTAQLGLFGKNITADLLQKSLAFIPSKFKYWDMSLNHHNLFSINDYPIYERKNFVLNLGQPYELLYKNYRDNIKRNIKKSKDFGCFPAKGIDVAEIISLAKLHGHADNDEDFKHFQHLYNLLAKMDLARAYGIYSVYNELLASSVFFFSHNRAYYILVGNHPNGRTLGASHALIDSFVKDYAEKKLLLDFEGSDLRNLAFFYSSFGATEERYGAIKMRRLPWYLKWARK
jgi:hypothetical protein